MIVDKSTNVPDNVAKMWGLRMNIESIGNPIYHLAEGLVWSDGDRTLY